MRQGARTFPGAGIPGSSSALDDQYALPGLAKSSPAVDDHPLRLQGIGAFEPAQKWGVANVQTLEFGARDRPIGVIRQQNFGICSATHIGTDVAYRLI